MGSIGEGWRWLSVKEEWKKLDPTSDILDTLLGKSMCFRSSIQTYSNPPGYAMELPMLLLLLKLK